MDQGAITREQAINAINLVATMAISNLAKEKKCPATEMFLSFMVSKTADCLYDPDTRLWCDGPSAVEAAYLTEIREGGKGVRHE